MMETDDGQTFFFQIMNAVCTARPEANRRNEVVVASAAALPYALSDIPAALK